MANGSLRWLLGCVGLLALAACDGGGGGGTTAPPVAAPGPTPTPTPIPTPTPTPAVLAAGRAYVASPLVGRIDFANSLGRVDGIVQGYTTRDGEYFPGYRNAIFGYQGVAAGGVANRDNSDKFKFVSALDQQTAITVFLQASPATKMVTPVTTLLVENGTDPTTLKTQLGITGSLFAMASNPDLAIYDAIAEVASGDAARAADAARMSAANVRALAINAGLGAIRFRATPDLAAREPFIGFREAGSVTLSSCLRDSPAQFIFTNDRMVNLAQCFMQSPAGNPATSITLRATTWQAIAHLINTYAAAIPVRLESSSDRARWMLGLQGYLVPTIAQIAAADSEVASTTALAITTQTVIDETIRYIDHYSYNATGLFMPGPDFLTISSGSTQSVDVDILRQTDRQFDTPNGGFGLSGIIRSVNVPASNATQLSASLTGNTVNVTVAVGYRGVTWFDYVTRSDAGEDRSARVYIRVY